MQMAATILSGIARSLSFDFRRDVFREDVGRSVRIIVRLSSDERRNGTVNPPLIKRQQVRWMFVEHPAMRIRFARESRHFQTFDSQSNRG
jgi:hypothetical protein